MIMLIRYIKSVQKYIILHYQLSQLGEKFRLLNAKLFTFKNYFTLDSFLMSDHQTFCSLFKIRRHFIVHINHDIVMGLCSDLFMWLYYQIYIAYGGNKISMGDSRYGIAGTTKTAQKCTAVLCSSRLELELHQNRSALCNQNSWNHWNR